MTFILSFVPVFCCLVDSEQGYEMRWQCIVRGIEGAVVRGLDDRRGGQGRWRRFVARRDELAVTVPFELVDVKTGDATRELQR